MNFENIPELRYRYSYFILLGTMLAVAASILFLFRRNGWIGGRRRREDGR
jgi:magnesium transporter